MAIFGNIFGKSRPPITGHFFLGKTGPLVPTEYGLYAIKEASTSSNGLVEELLARVPSEGECLFSRVKEKPSHLSFHLTLALLTAYASYVNVANQFLVGGGFGIAFDTGLRAGFKRLAEAQSSTGDLQRIKRFEDWTWTFWSMYCQAMAFDIRLRRTTQSSKPLIEDEQLTKLFVEHVDRAYDDDSYPYSEN